MAYRPTAAAATDGHGATLDSASDTDSADEARRAVSGEEEAEDEERVVSGEEEAEASEGVAATRAATGPFGRGPSAPSEYDDASTAAARCTELERTVADLRLQARASARANAAGLSVASSRRRARR